MKIREAHCSQCFSCTSPTIFGVLVVVALVVVALVVVALVVVALDADVA